MLKGKSIYLRLFNCEQDVLEHINLNNNLDIRSPLDHTEISPEIRGLKAYREGGFWSKDSGVLLIINCEEKIVGNISFSRKDEFEIAIGYRIYRTEDRNRGYMGEALKLFVNYLFNTIPQFTRLSLYTAENNLPSRRLAEKTGFTQEGILRDAYFYRGEVCNWVIYSLLRREL